MMTASNQEEELNLLRVRKPATLNSCSRMQMSRASVGRRFNDDVDEPDVARSVFKSPPPHCSPRVLHLKESKLCQSLEKYQLSKRWQTQAEEREEERLIYFIFLCPPGWWQTISLRCNHDYFWWRMEVWSASPGKRQRRQWGLSLFSPAATGGQKSTRNTQRSFNAPPHQRAGPTCCPCAKRLQNTMPAALETAVKLRVKYPAIFYDPVGFVGTFVDTLIFKNSF